MSEPIARDEGNEPPAAGNAAGAATSCATGDAERLGDLAEEFTARCRRGERPSVDEYARRHPDLAEQIRDLFPALLALEHSVGGGVVGGGGPGHAPSVGAVVGGRYRLLERLGEGGFGVVYMAEQHHPVRRKVALKVIKPGLDTQQVIARFEAERQALALMDHPNIAKVLDGGATDAGRPYFVMELVKGVPITDFCDQRRLPPRRRLELFVQVCRAVQHAHTKGVIHRDLKPTNILVTLHDGIPVPKVIDFGVAKATAGPQLLTDRTLFTRFAQMVGTPLYMSPEQAELSGLDIDTRSDVYSLGVLLYELLTGTTPLQKERLAKAAYDEVRRIIRDEDPPRPSTRLSTLGASITSISATRDTDPKKLGQLVRGELDWIVMRALEKDRARRYETANAFARDVERYLSDEPVEACPPSRLYLLRKLTRRNKGPIAAAAVVLLTLVGGIVGTSFGLLRAEQARRTQAEQAKGERQAKQEAQAREAEAEAVIAFVEQKVLAAARPEGIDGGLGHDVTLRRAIEATLPSLDKSFADRPLIEARLRMTLGRSFADLGDSKIAAGQFEAARTLYAKHAGPDHSRTVASINDLANSYTDLGRYSEALPLREEVVAHYKARLGPDHPNTLTAMSSLANCYLDVGRGTEATELHERVLALRRARLGADHPDTLTSMHNLAACHYTLGRLAEAIKLGNEVLTLRKAKLGIDHPDTLSSKHNLANYYGALGRNAEALRLREEVLAIDKARLGPGHPYTLGDMNNLANSYGNLGRNGEALAMREELLAIYRAKFGPDHPDTLMSMGNLAVSYFRAGRQAEALRLWGEVLAVRKTKLGPDDPDTLAAAHVLVSALVQSGRGAEAIPIIDEFIRRAEQNGAGAGPLTDMVDHRLRYFQNRRDAPGCRATAETWERLKLTSDGDFYNAACNWAVTAAVRRAAGEPDGIADAEADRAMHWLARAVAAGYANAVHMGHDSDLDALRSRQDFRELIARLDTTRLAELSRDVERCPGSPHALGARAKWLLEHGRFAEADGDYARLLRLHPVDHWHWYYRGCLLAYLGREDDYRRHCRAMLEQFASSTDRYELDRTTKPALLLPGGVGGDVNLLAARAGRLLAAERSDAYSQLVKGMAEYRAGRFAEAAVWLDRCSAADGPRVTARTAAADAFLALARHRLGQADEARAALDRCVRRIDQDLRKPGDGDLAPSAFGIENWLIAHVARREAEQVILGRTAAVPPVLAAAALPAPAPPTQPSPRRGQPATMPGLVQAEDFDDGGEGVAYHDLTYEGTGVRTGPPYLERPESVDLEDCTDADGGRQVCAILAGEWLAYTVDVKQACPYDVSLRLATPRGGGRLHVEFAGQDLSGPVAVPETGGWSNWTTVTVKGVRPRAGRQVMRVVFDASVGFAGADLFVCNFNWIELKPSATSQPAN